MELAQDSAQIEYRDFIVEQLEKMSKEMSSADLNEYENFKRHWNLLRYLEKSFEADGTFKQNKAFGSGKDRIIVNESEIKALTIEKIKKYPEEWKSKIATALFFSSFGKHHILFVTCRYLFFTKFSVKLDKYYQTNCAPWEYRDKK